MHHRYDHASGRITESVAGPVILEDHEGLVPVQAGENDATHYIVAGVATKRPSLPFMAATREMSVNEVWSMTLPAGTVVYVNSRNEGEWNGTIQFGAAAVYNLRFVPPFPLREAACVVTVT